MDWLGFLKQILSAVVLMFARQSGKDAAFREVAEKKLDEHAESLGIEDRYKRDASFRDRVQSRFDG